MTHASRLVRLRESRLQGITLSALGLVGGEKVMVEHKTQEGKWPRCRYIEEPGFRHFRENDRVDAMDYQGRWFRGQVWSEYTVCFALPCLASTAAAALTENVNSSGLVGHRDARLDPTRGGFAGCSFVGSDHVPLSYRGALPGAYLVLHFTAVLCCARSDVAAGSLERSLKCFFPVQASHFSIQLLHCSIDTARATARTTPNRP